MAPRRTAQPTKLPALALPPIIGQEVQGWRKQGYHPFPSETTRQLLRHWFDRDDEAGARFHDCQRWAIETIIYLHEVQGIRTLRQLYEKHDPSRLKLSKAVADEVARVSFMKYCLKMATGSGKTWVLAALIVWQYFNAINEETACPYSARFLVVTPGLEVQSRILDSFKGPRDPASKNRVVGKSDFRNELFMPEDAHWKGRFNLLNEIIEPRDIRGNASPPDGPFVAVLNWQQFRMAKDEQSLAEQMGLDTPEEPQGEIIADYLSEFPDLIIMNDEAHHVHGKKTTKGDELVWRKFMHVLDERMRERHGDQRGAFLQIDFSATPFFGSGLNREYFPHIVYDYDLRAALNDMLVKQLFLEERRAGGDRPQEDLDFRAVRDKEAGRRGEALKLSGDQILMLEIGRQKLHQLAEDFWKSGLNRKPVLMVLCEDIAVAKLVEEHCLTQPDEKDKLYDEKSVLCYHSDLSDKEQLEAQDKLHAIDNDVDPLRIVVSVLKLREGFDKTNICVIVVMRATEADLLLEQIVGRGLRLMFPAHDRRYADTIQDVKRQDFEALKKGEKPRSSLDFLYIVEHPRFRTFYDDLRRQGYLIGAGDTSDTTPTGDLITVEAAPERIAERDIAWPHAVYEQGAGPDLSQINVAELPRYTANMAQLRTLVNTLTITDRHLETDTRTSWDMKMRFWDYQEYLRSVSLKIAREGKTQVLSGRLAEIAALVDEYTTTRLFPEPLDPTNPNDVRLLAWPDVETRVVETIRKAIAGLLAQPRYEVTRGRWRRLSDLDRIHVREDACIQTRKSIYPLMGYQARGGGFEREVMQRLLDTSAEVLAWCKLQRRHDLRIDYRDETGIARSYDVDFILRTADSVYLLETKADRDVETPLTALKARAAQCWCEQMSGIRCDVLPQPERVEYLLLSESLHNEHAGQSFAAVLPRMRQLRDRIIAQNYEGTLFV